MAEHRGQEVPRVGIGRIAQARVAQELQRAVDVAGLECSPSGGANDVRRARLKRHGTFGDRQRGGVLHQDQHVGQVVGGFGVARVEESSRS